MEYTKGNWKASKSPMGDWIISTEDTLICREVRHFNAHLIAAAPEMYEALKSWGELYAMRPIDSGDDIQKILKRCWCKTEKALAKAEGKGGS